MKILVYGAGALGSLLAVRLHISGQQTALLARGKRLADLQQNGVILEDLFTRERRSFKVPVVAGLAAEDDYDWIIVVMGKQDLPEILPILAANQKVPNILFMGNNVAGGGELASAIGSERLLLGFLMAVGKIDGPVAYAGAEVGDRKSTSYIGELDGSTTPRLIELAAVFENCGLPVQISPNIEAWLKCHAALILSLGGAYYLSGCNLEYMPETRDTLIMFARGAREALQVLRAYRIPILPPRLKIFLWTPEPLLVVFLARMLRNPLLSSALIHAEGVRPELNQLGREFTALACKANIITPHLDRLILATRPNARTLPAGSQELPMDWRGVWVGVGALAAAAGLLYGVWLLRGRRADP